VFVGGVDDAAWWGQKCTAIKDVAGRTVHSDRGDDLLFWECLFCRRDGSSKRLGRKEVNLSKRQTYNLTLALT